MDATAPVPALPDNEKLYGLLFDNMLNGFAYCQMFFDEAGRPIDFTYLLVNHQFEELTGLKDVVGKKVTEIIPGVRDTNPELFEIYGRVAQTGRAEKFETEIKQLNTWFYVSVFSPLNGYFGAVFDVITARKIAEEELRKKIKDLEKINEILVGRENKMVELKQTIKTLESTDTPSSEPQI
jgi:PAS domain-containing protein